MNTVYVNVMLEKNNMEICVDFDGTCVTHAYPYVGKDIGAVDVLKELVSKGHKLILWTMRSDKPEGNYLQQAVKWFNDNDIPLYGIQKNPEQSSWTSSPKAYAQLYIDDAGAGCPLKYDPQLSNRRFVDWQLMREFLISENII